MVTGPETLLAERAVARFQRTALDERGDAIRIQVEASELDSGKLAEFAGGSLLADSTILVVTGLAELPVDLSDQIHALAAGPGPDLALALVHGGGVKGKALLDRLKKLRLRQAECATIKPWNLPRFVMGEFRELQGRIDERAASLLVDSVGADTRALAAAVQQLMADTDDGRISEAVVRRYFGGRAEVSSYAVAGDVLTGDLAGSLGKLRWALTTGTPAVLVTSALASELRSLGRYLSEQDSTLREPELAAKVGVPAWKLKDLSRNSRGWTPAGIARGIKAVALADAQIKGAANDPDFALEQLMIQLVSCRTPRR